MAEILISGFVVGMIQTNVWFLHRSDRTETILVDPADQGKALYDTITGLNIRNEEAKEGEARLEIGAVLLTHGHFDHIGGIPALRQVCKAPLLANEAEKQLCQDPEANLSASYRRPTTVEPDVWLRDGTVFERCGIHLKMIATPGHTEGSCCYYIEGGTQENSGSPILIAGDTLFRDSVGRTDMPTGDWNALVHSVRDKLFLLPDDTRVFPGHGPCTTIGHEKGAEVV